jgi:uncharacterized SAM-binding protein YcdF (DUF218 family)
MFFILSKILAFLFTPIIWIITLLLIALFSRNANRKRKSLLAGILMLLIFSNTFLFDEAMRLWEVPAVKDSQLNGTYDTGIILGGLMFIDNYNDRLQFNRRNDRLMQGVLLYKKGIIKKILFTSGSGSLEYPDIKEAPLARRFLLSIGIPDEDVLIESESNNTHENAKFSKAILDKKFPGGKFLVITSAFHMRRSLACFAKEGINTTPYSTDRYSGPRKFVFAHAFIPRAETLFNWDTLIHEMIGCLTYKFAGYI